MRKTITEAELRRRVEAGETHAAIAKTLECPHNYVANACRILGIKSFQGRRPGKLNDEMCSAVVQRIGKGELLKQIAPSIGVSIGGLHGALSSRGLPTSAVELLKRQATAAKLDKLTP